MTNTITATPCKLRDGTWGAKTSETIRKGDIVMITTRAGKSWDARITRVVWTGDDVAICATESMDRQPQRSSNYDPSRFNGYGARRGGYVRRCKTDGNCSSMGSGRSCGAEDCDGF